MKTIKVFILSKLVDFSDEPNDWAWLDEGLTVSFQEAEDWRNKGNEYDYKEFSLALPKEIPVQADY